MWEPSTVGLRFNCFSVLVREFQGIGISHQEVESDSDCFGLVLIPKRNLVA